MTKAALIITNDNADKENFTKFSSNSKIAESNKELGNTTLSAYYKKIRDDYIILIVFSNCNLCIDWGISAKLTAGIIHDFFNSEPEVIGKNLVCDLLYHGKQIEREHILDDELFEENRKNFFELTQKQLGNSKINLSIRNIIAFRHETGNKNFINKEIIKNLSNIEDYTKIESVISQIEGSRVGHTTPNSKSNDDADASKVDKCNRYAAVVSTIYKIEPLVYTIQVNSMQSEISLEYEDYMKKVFNDFIKDNLLKENKNYGKLNTSYNTHRKSFLKTGAKDLEKITETQLKILTRFQEDLIDLLNE